MDSPECCRISNIYPLQVESHDSNLTTNGVATSLVNPVFGDHGDQTPAVHAEEVVETAVSVLYKILHSKLT